MKSSQSAINISPLKITKVISYNDYMIYTNAHKQTNLEKLTIEKNLIPEAKTEFHVNGYCYVCKAYVDFLVDFNHCYNIDGFVVPNWRERLVCPDCHLNNRMRAAIHIFHSEFHPETQSRIYITEQTSFLYKKMSQCFTHLCGSEYIGNSVRNGSCNKNGIRNEDLTCLSFDNNQFDYILSFDILEHIPNYTKALKECYRCLKPGGAFFFSVPFERTSEKNIVRAQLSSEGEILNLLPPEYHENPIRPEGCLCFYHFGWNLIDELREAGFKDSKVILYWSKEYGYLGGDQLFIAGRKIPEKNFS